jgi:uncharacterized protein (TIGR02145 family)
MKKLFSMIALSLMLLSPVLLFTQTIPKTLDVYEKNGNVTKFPLENIDKITIGGPQIAWTDKMVRDGDGNIYQTVTIGHQVWLASNLKTTTYNDGTPIKNVKPGDEWVKTNTGAYCWYMNNSDNKDTYGALYNWYAVEGDRICPKGFHVPRKEEWRALIDYIGSREVGLRIRVPGTQYWKKNNPQTNNSTGFSALPAGSRQLNGAFGGDGEVARWWSSDARNENESDSPMLLGENSIVYIYNAPKKLGFSIRCVRD